MNPWTSRGSRLVSRFRRVHSSSAGLGSAALLLYEPHKPPAPDRRLEGLLVVEQFRVFAGPSRRHSDGTFSLVRNSRITSRARRSDDGSGYSPVDQSLSVTLLPTPPLITNTTSLPRAHCRMAESRWTKPNSFPSEPHAADLEEAQLLPWLATAFESFCLTSRFELVMASLLLQAYQIAPSAVNHFPTRGRLYFRAE